MELVRKKAICYKKIYYRDMALTPITISTKNKISVETLKKGQINMKKIIAAIIAAALITSAFTACSGGNEDNNTTTTTAASENTSETTEDTSASDETSAADNTEETENTDNTENPPASDGEAAKILDAIKNAYGENYLPNMPIDETYLTTVLGLEEGSFTDFAGELPMISAHADMAVIVKAAEGKADDVKAKLETYQKYLIEESLQYPMNVAKVNASKVLENGDYLGFIILGAFGDDENTDETQQAEFAEEQVKIGVDAFNSYFE